MPFIDLVYRRHRPVFWSPSSVSALAEAEVQYVDDHASRSAYITFPITSPSEHGSQLQHIIKEHVQREEEVSFLVWTTTPWTIPANMVLNSHLSISTYQESYSAVERVLR